MAPQRRKFKQAEHFSSAFHMLSVRAGLTLSIALVMVTIILIPFGLVSIFQSARGGATSSSYEVMSATNLSREWTKLNVSAESLNETNREVTLDVSGFHNCPNGCGAPLRIELFSIESDPHGSLGEPPSETIDLPADSSEVDQDITLPVDGDLTSYPFDSYKLVLGVRLYQVTKSGGTVPTGRAEADRLLALTVDSRVSRTKLDTPQVLDAQQLSSNAATYDAVAKLTLSRPLYLKIVTVLLILLIIFAEAYAVFGRPFETIIPTIGGLVLGMWGIRTLLVGSYPPDSTGVDLILEAAILFLLLAFAVRAAIVMFEHGTIDPADHGEPAASDALST